MWTTLTRSCNIKKNNEKSEFSSENFYLWNQQLQPRSNDLLPSYLVLIHEFMKFNIFVHISGPWRSTDFVLVSKWSLSKCLRPQPQSNDRAGVRRPKSTNPLSSTFSPKSWPKSYVNSVFKQPSKLHTAVKMNVVFFSLHTKTADNEQWWTAMLKKREKLKNLNFTAIRSSNSHQNSKLSWIWTLFSSLFVRLPLKTSNDELQC